MGILSGKLLKFGIPTLVTGSMALQEIPKITQAHKEGKTFEQSLGSIWNVAKWSIVPAALAIANPAGVLACTAIGLASFILPAQLPDINLCEKNNSTSLLA